MREALRRSEAELEMEREMRQCTEADNDIERQLRYEVERDIEIQMARAVESERRFENLMHRHQRALGYQRILDEERPEMIQFRSMVSVLPKGSSGLAFELFSNAELKRRVPVRRRLSLRSRIREAYRGMMHDRDAGPPEVA